MGGVCSSQQAAAAKAPAAKAAALANNVVKQAAAPEKTVAEAANEAAKTAANKAVKTATEAVAKAVLTKEQTAALDACFKALDRNSSGYVDLKELRQYLGGAGVNFDTLSKDARALMDKLDHNKDNKISHDEFTAAMSVVVGVMSTQSLSLMVDSITNASSGIVGGGNMLSGVLGLGPRHEKLMHCFESLDLDKSGHIDEHEFMEYVKNSGVDLSSLTSDAKSLMDKLDHNKDQVVSKEEFTMVMTAITTTMSDEDFNAVVDNIAKATKGVVHKAEHAGGNVLGSVLTAGPRYEKLLACFKALDKDKSNYVDLVELKQYLNSSGVDMSLVTGDAGALMAKLDRNGDSRITQEEFLIVMAGVVADMNDESFATLAGAIQAAAKGSTAEGNVLGHAVVAGARAERLLQCFKALDKDKSGYVDLREFRMYLESAGVNMGTLPHDAQSLMDRLDKNKDEKVTKDEYMVAMASIVAEMNEDVFQAMCDAILKATAEGNVLGAVLVAGARAEKLAAVFAALDRDGSGFIDITEFRQYLASAGVDDSSMSSEAQAILARLDVNKDAKVTKDEWQTVMAAIIKDMEDPAFQDMTDKIIAAAQGQRLGAGDDALGRALKGASPEPPEPAPAPAPAAPESEPVPEEAPAPPAQEVAAPAEAEPEPEPAAELEAPAAEPEPEPEAPPAEAEVAEEAPAPVEEAAVEEVEAPPPAEEAAAGVEAPAEPEPAADAPPATEEEQPAA